MTDGTFPTRVMLRDYKSIANKVNPGGHPGCKGLIRQTHDPRVSSGGGSTGVRGGFRPENGA